MLHFAPATVAEEPTIVKYVEKTHTGIETINLSRYAIALLHGAGNTSTTAIVVGRSAVANYST